VFYTGGPSSAASLTIAGSVNIKKGKINAPGGLTVWGIVDNIGADADSTVITDKNTPFTAWTAFLYGASFGGPVNLPGSIANTFGGQATFDGELKIAGPVTFQKGTFNGETLFGNAVQFISSGSDDKIEFNKNVTFAGDVQLYENVTFSSEGGTYYKSITGVDFNTIDNRLSPGGNDASYKISGDTVTKPTSGSFSVDVLVSGENVTVADDVKFEKNATFEGNVTFTGKPTFGTVATVTSSGEPAGSTTTIINGLAVFEDGADFGGTLVADGTGLKPVGNVVILEEAEFKSGATFKNIADLKLGNSSNPAVEFTAGTAGYAIGSGAITIPTGGGMEFKDNTLTFTGNGGTLGTAVALNGATVQLASGAVMTFDQTGSTPFKVMQAGSGGGGFKITGKAELDSGAIKGVGNGVAVQATGNIVLEIPAATGEIPISAVNLGIYNALVDLSEAGAIVFAGTTSRIVLHDNNANIKTGSGLAVPKGQSINKFVIIAGAGLGGSAALLTGSLGADGIAIAGSIGTLGGGTYEAATYSPGSESACSNVLNRWNGFVLVGTDAAAGSISSNTSTAIESAIGNIAVFSSEGILF
jgi:hypothetical protein